MWIDVFRIITITKSYFYLIGVKSTFNFGFPFASKKSTIACLMYGGSRSPALKKQKRKNFDEILMKFYQSLGIMQYTIIQRYLARVQHISVYTCVDASQVFFVNCECLEKLREIIM